MRVTPAVPARASVTAGRMMWTSKMPPQPPAGRSLSVRTKTRNSTGIVTKTEIALGKRAVKAELVTQPLRQFRLVPLAEAHIDRITWAVESQEERDKADDQQDKRSPEQAAKDVAAHDSLSGPRRHP